MRRLVVLHPLAATDAVMLLIGGFGCALLALGRWLTDDDAPLADLGGDD